MECIGGCCLLVNKLLDRFLNKNNCFFQILGDDFVDFFMSRDIDAWVTGRELTAVNDWLTSNTLFHIMRGTN